MSSEDENTAFNGHPDFGLPEGYFQQSARSVFNKIEWIEEHKDFPGLSSLGENRGFITPPGYFSASEQKLELVDCPVLGALPKANPFTTPENYFEAAELNELSEVITDHEISFKIPKQNNFKVAAGYFSENKTQLASLLVSKANKPARRINLFGSRTFVAAAALLILALGLWLHNFYFKPAEVKDCGTMACIEKSDLLKTKNLDGLETDELYELVNSKELEQKLEKNSKATEKNKPDSTDDGATDYLPDDI